MAGTHYGDSGTRQYGHIPAHIEDQRRIVDLFEGRRIGCVLQRDDVNARRRGAGELILSKLHRSGRYPAIVRPQPEFLLLQVPSTWR